MLLRRTQLGQQGTHSKENPDTQDTQRGRNDEQCHCQVRGQEGLALYKKQAKSIHSFIQPIGDRPTQPRARLAWASQTTDQSSRRGQNVEGVQVQSRSSGSQGILGFWPWRWSKKAHKAGRWHTLAYFSTVSQWKCSFGFHTVTTFHSVWWSKVACSRIRGKEKL